MKRRRVYVWLQVVAALAVAVLGLTACQASTPAPPDTALPDSSPVPTATHGELPSAAPAAPVEMSTPQTPSPEATSTDSDGLQVVDLAVKDLSQQLSVPEESILVKSVEAVEWPDASLDCPQPGMVYAQVVTPGYLILLSVDDETYAYHTDRDQVVFLCADQPLSQADAPADIQLPIFVEMVQAPLSPELSPQMPPADGRPSGVYLFDPNNRSLLVASDIQILPTTEVAVGLSSASVPGQPYIASDLYQIPSAQQAPLRVIAVDADTGTLTLEFADQTFELGPGQSRSFKQTGEGELAPLTLTTITNYGSLATIGSLPPEAGTP